MTDAERFMTKIEMVTETGCWIWLGGVFNNGYPRFKARGRDWRAHRWSYSTFVGPIPDGMNVCHRCDEPLCVNPQHLWLGTHADNHKDRNMKGRQACGSRNGKAKLTEAAVRRIRNDYRSSTVLAREYGVDPSVICAIRRRAAWKHVK